MFVRMPQRSGLVGLKRYESTDDLSSGISGLQRRTESRWSGWRSRNGTQNAGKRNAGMSNAGKIAAGGTLDDGSPGIRGNHGSGRLSQPEWTRLEEAPGWQNDGESKQKAKGVPMSDPSTQLVANLTKQAIEKPAKGTLDAALAVAGPASAGVALMTWRSFLCRFEGGQDQDGVQPREQELWRTADELAGPSPSPLTESLSLTVAFCEARRPVPADAKRAVEESRQPGPSGRI